MSISKTSVFLLMLLPALCLSAPQSVYYVAATGDDSAAGSMGAPFRTLERARQAVRDHKGEQGIPADGLRVAIRGGVYERAATFVLSAEDSGVPAAPVTWGAYQGEAVSLSGGVRIDLTDVGPVSAADPVWARLPVAARDSVLVADLAGQGIDLGQLRRRGYLASNRTSALEVVIDCRPGNETKAIEWRKRDAS